MAKNNKDKNKNKGGGGVKQVIRQAGPNISKKEMKKIVKAAGGNVTRAINRIASVQKNMAAKNQPAPAVASGAANLLIKQAEKAPAFKKPDFGQSKLGQTLQSMVAKPAVPGAMIKGQRVGGSPAQPGFNPGGAADKNRMIGGTVIRPGGRIAVRQQAAAPAAAPVDTGLDTGGGDTGTGFGDGFDFESYLNDLMSGGDDLGLPEMPQLESFDQLSSEFDTPNALSFASLGQSYLTDAIRAARRQQQSRRDYLRNSMAQMAAPLSAMLSIGGGIGGLM